MSESQEVQTASRGQPRQKRAAVVELHDRLRGGVQLAIRLKETYEFHVDAAGTLKLEPLAAVVPHTWVSEDLVRARGRQAKLVETVRLGPQQRFDLDVPLGLKAVFGRSGTGKTRLAFDRLFMTLATSSNSNPRYIRVFEPSDPIRDRRALELLPAHIQIDEVEFESDLALLLARYLTDPDVDVIIIDSLRYLFYSSAGGATGKGGVNMGLFMDLTHLDKVARRLGKRIVCVINPMTDDETSFNFYIEAAVGAVSSLVITDSPTSGRAAHRFSPSRDFTSISFTPTTVLDKDKVAARGAGEKSHPQVSNQPAAVNTALFGANKRS